MPRANRRRRDEAPLDVARIMGGVTQRQPFGGSEWFVRRVSGQSSERSYWCPGCQQEVRPGTPHVVAWPADGVGGVEDRRHWHTPCWDARERRHTRGAIR